MSKNVLPHTFYHLLESSLSIPALFESLHTIHDALLPDAFKTAQVFTTLWNSIRAGEGIYTSSAVLTPLRLERILRAKWREFKLCHLAQGQ
eukprot:4317663-Amphidinium_carterae.1